MTAAGGLGGDVGSAGGSGVDTDTGGGLLCGRPRAALRRSPRLRSRLPQPQQPEPKSVALQSCRSCGAGAVNQRAMALLTYCKGKGAGLSCSGYCRDTGACAAPCSRPSHPSSADSQSWLARSRWR
jgi:hypothetical protein